MAIFSNFLFQAIQARKMSFTINQSEKTPFQAIKTRSSKSRNIDIFLKGLTHGFGPTMASFPNFRFQAIYSRKMCFTICQTEETPFQDMKTRISKSRNIDIFPKGLTHGFCPKMVIFPNFCFQAIQARKMSFTIFQSEKTPFQYRLIRSSKRPKNDIFPKGLTHGFGPKMGIFSTFVFQAIQASKMSFTIFQSEKTPFQAIKRRSSKIRKINIFPRRLTHGFSYNIAIFKTFFFDNIVQ